VNLPKVAVEPPVLPCDGVKLRSDLLPTSYRVVTWCTMLEI
jgi:hypothetical protein